MGNLSTMNLPLPYIQDFSVRATVNVKKDNLNL